jgi:hypothetical protein
MNGRAIKENQYENVTNILDFDISDLKSGLYNIVILNSDKILSTKKIIKVE